MVTKRKPYFSGVQDIVLCVIKEYILLGNKYMDRALIDQEVSNTAVGDFIREHYKGQEAIILKKKVDLALHQLEKKGEIKHFKDKKGFWTLDNYAEDKKLKPIRCEALKHEYEVSCANCGEFTYEKRRVSRCSNCKSKSITVRIFRSYCPIRKKYVDSKTHISG
jgi:hypothetical protein